MSDNRYQEFEDASFTKFRKRLLTKQGSKEFQQEFLGAAQNNSKFLDFIREHVRIEGSKVIDLCPNRLTESEFRMPPINTEVGLYNVWSSLTPRIACRTTFWANVTFRHIENDRIQASYLAASGKSDTSGSRTIDLQLRGQAGENRDRDIDRSVRRMLRHLGGLQERGNRSVYVDCPFARAWWREFLVRQAVPRGNPSLMYKVQKLTRLSKDYWEKLVVLVVSRNSVLGSSGIRNSLIISLAELCDKEPDTPLGKASGLLPVCRAISSIQASRELSVLNDDELREIMNKVVIIQHSNLSN